MKSADVYPQRGLAARPMIIGFSLILDVLDLHGGAA
jgi:hypothetical protein